MSDGSLEAVRSAYAHRKSTSRRGHVLPHERWRRLHYLVSELEEANNKIASFPESSPDKPISLRGKISVDSKAESRVSLTDARSRSEACTGRSSRILS